MTVVGRLHGPASTAYTHGMVDRAELFLLALLRRPTGKLTTGTTARIATRLLERVGRGKGGSRGKSLPPTSPLIVKGRRVCGWTLDERVSHELLTW